MSLFTAVEMAPRDPILGLNEQFAADTNPNKVNLGVGVYFDDNGKLPLLKCVQQAEANVASADAQRASAEADLENARQKLDRARQLKATGAITQAKVDELEQKLRAANVKYEFHRYNAKHAFANETADSKNLPILSTIKGWKYGFNSPFKADVYYVTTRLFTGNKWGTSNPVMLRDADFGMVRVRAFGTYDFKIVQPKVFLKEVAGSDQNFHLDEFSDTMRSRIVSIFTDAVASVKVQVLDVDPMIVASGFAVVLVRMGVCRREAGGAQRVRMLVGVVVFAHHQNLGSTAPAIAMSAKSTIASPLFAPKRGSRSRSAPSESDPVAPRALAASSTRVARA